MSIVISFEDRRKMASNLVQFDQRRRRKNDCQGGNYTLSSLKGSVLAINPTGMDIGEIVEKERIRQQCKKATDARNKIADGFCELIEVNGLADAHNWLRTLLDGDKGKAS